MNRYIILNIVLVALVMISCNSKDKNSTNDYNRIIGKWECPINNDTFKGTEIIDFQPDSSVKIIDNLILALSDKDIKVAIRCTAQNNGKWILNKNIINLTLDDLQINIDTTTMVITTLVAHTRLDTTNIAYANIKKEILNYTNNIIKNTFEDRSNRRLELGNVFFHHPDSMIIVNSGRTINLSRSN